MICLSMLILKNMEENEMIKKIMEYIFDQIPKKLIFSYIIGTNHTSRKMIGYEKGTTIKINKEYPSFKIIAGFFYRSFAFACIIYWINATYIRSRIFNFLTNSVSDTSLLHIGLLVLTLPEFFVFENFISRVLKKRLHEVGFDKRENQKYPQCYTLLRAFELSVFVPIFLSSAGYEKTWLIYLLLLPFALLYITFVEEKIEKKNIISFHSRIDNDDSKNSVDIEKEISILLNTNETIPVNLLNTRILIKNNDDILLIFKNREKQIVERKTILYIKIKNHQLRYVNNQWVNGGTIFYNR